MSVLSYSLVHVTSVCDDCPRSVLLLLALWLALGVALVLLYCLAVLQINTVYIVGDRSKNKSDCPRRPKPQLQKI